MIFIRHFLTLAAAAICGLASLAQAQQQPFDEQDARLWAERGDPDSQFDLGLRLVTGEGLKKNESEGVQWLTKAANQDHLRAQHVLGSLHEEGLGVKQDMAKALEWYKKSANNGFAMAQHSLAILYDSGRGVTKDEKEAAIWLRKAANQDFAPAQAAYASKLERGSGLEKDTAKAASWYLRAAQGRFIPGMTRLAYMYYTGKGVPLDYRRAGSWYVRASRSGNPWAMNDLAWFLSTCPDDKFHDPETAVELAKLAVKEVAEESGEQPHEMVDTLAASMARSGDYLGAVLWQKKALTLLAEDKKVEKADRDKLQAEFNGRLKLYQKQTPYSEAAPSPEPGAKPLPGDTILQEENFPGRKAPPKRPSGKGRGSVVFAAPARTGSSAI